MAVLVTSRVPGLSPEQYAELAATLTDKLKAAPGFIAHYAWHSSAGMNVVEVWESTEQHDDWFGNNVRPHLPGTASQEQHELVNQVTA